MTSKRLGYVPALDGLRAVAITLVIAYHATGMPPGGMLGVDLFFVLSGFLITTLLLDEYDARGAIRLSAFYVRRARRLLPALFALLAGYALLGLMKGDNVLGEIGRAGFYTANLERAFRLPDPLAHSGIRHLWSLAEEEQFYLVWPAVVLILKAARRPVLWFAAIFIGLVAYRILLLHVYPVSGLHVYYGPDMRSDGLAAGALLAVISRRALFTPPEWLLPLLVAALGIAVTIPETGFWWPEYGTPLFNLVAALLIAAAVTETSLAGALATPALVWVGKRSYSLYLWHLPLIWALGTGRWPLAVGLSVLAAWASYRFVEQPFRTRRTIELPRPPEAVQA